MDVPSNVSKLFVDSRDCEDVEGVGVVEVVMEVGNDHAEDFGR